MPKPKIGDTFIAQFQIVAEVENEEMYNGQTLHNYFCHLFWAVPLANPDGPRMLCYFDENHDPLIQSIQEFNLKPLDENQLRAYASPQLERAKGPG